MAGVWGPAGLGLGQEREGAAAQNPVLLQKHRGNGLEGPAMPPWGNDRRRPGTSVWTLDPVRSCPGRNVYKEATYDF